MNDAIKILEMALEAANDSMRDFDMYQEFEADGDQEAANSWWSSCRYHDGMAIAYLKVYEMLTGIKVDNVPCDIKKELAALL